MTLNIFSIFKFDYDWIEAIFYKISINSYGVYVFKKETRKNISYVSKKRICNTVNSRVNSSKSNNPNTSNIDNGIGNSNLPSINVQSTISFDILITLQKEADTESSTIINIEINIGNNISEDISYHQNSEEVIDHTCDDMETIYSI